ncbi:acetyl-CoA carboxylase carboxyltransferase subunit alpha [Sphaerisporangium sp. TRM90804]|uniref:acetyl-CoA carboxylase carboxyltransferase subunit alpha n=1 Tax=Sphaerisporangium sp. TRM90804 TaxID=3031113 RepID=UPI002447D06B|nr:acetyl-CoA carboxylase carboxyltransferase subunit alpha [Sphaerisporangium sp. TRM90804]MDH2427212.1 acetyl-CoA carboxylase carboxyltransferase subunit alpha [Sphaerisporangium sp. TRM90804]
MIPVRTRADLADEWTKCPGCGTLAYTRRFVRELMVCRDCGRHARLTAGERIATLLDTGSARPLPFQAGVFDPLDFTDSVPYADRVREARETTGLEEAVVCVRGEIEGHAVVAAVMDFRFMGGSLGSAAGELVTLAAEAALAERVPLLLVTASGGARMQEGALSLMQMAKTSQALAALDEAGVLTVSLLTDPTYGGVAASFASLTDVILAEPGARMGFAGPRVIQQTIRQELPKGFQTAEFLFARGLIDDIQPRRALRGTLGRLLSLRAPRSFRQIPPRSAPPLVRDPRALPERDAWEAVSLARHVTRPTTLDLLYSMLDGFTELHGDRQARDCPAVVGGVGWLDGAPVVVVGHQKGHGSQEMARRNFGMPSPAGCRKAGRLMRLAAKWGVPVVTFIDTPGAYPGIEAEEGGQALAIAENLRLMSTLPVPVLSIVTGEGGSGGALALGVANRVYAMSNAVYSVISPEGCAAILWKDAAAAAQAAQALRVDARNLLEAGIIDAVIPEPDGGAHIDLAATAETLRAVIVDTLHDLSSLDGPQLVKQRRHRFRAFGATSCHPLPTPGHLP